MKKAVLHARLANLLCLVYGLPYQLILRAVDGVDNECVKILSTVIRKSCWFIICCTKYLGL